MLHVHQQRGQRRRRRLGQARASSSAVQRPWQQRRLPRWPSCEPGAPLYPNTNHMFNPAGRQFSRMWFSNLASCRPHAHTHLCVPCMEAVLRYSHITATYPPNHGLMCALLAA